MKPIEWLRSIYETFGTPHPRLSMVVVILLGGVVSGLVWQFAAKQVEKSHQVLSASPKTGSAVTTGSQSPAITGQENQVTYGQVPAPEKKDTPQK